MPGSYMLPSMSYDTSSVRGGRGFHVKLEPTIQFAERHTRSRRTSAAATFMRLSATAIRADAAGETKANVGFSTAKS